MESITGLLVRSAKGQFIVGADITEFGEAFKQSDEHFGEWLPIATKSSATLKISPSRPLPLSMHWHWVGAARWHSTDFRLIDTKGKIGLPETQLGIIPGFGGTVRMPRVIGVDNAIGNITAGNN